MVRKEDILRITEVYGIFNKVNQHSFSNYRWQIKLVYCCFCDQLINPILEHCYCQRCGSSCHKECQNSTLLCSKFTVNCTDESTSNSQESKACLIDKVVQNICHLPYVFGGCIPSVGSDYCLWRSAIMSTASISIDETSYTQLVESAMNPLDVGQILSNNDTFPGTVTAVCSKIILSLNFSSLEEMFMHARACIETISLSFYIGRTEDAIDIDNFTQLSCSVENFLMAYNGRAIYDKMFQQITKVSKVMRLLKSLSPPFNSFDTVDMIYMNELGAELVRSTSPQCKMMSLVRILQYLSSNSHGNTVETDELLSIFASIISYQNSSEIVDWYAECLYLTSSFVQSSPSHELNGIEEYSIVTLQQCMQILLKANK